MPSYLETTILHIRIRQKHRLKVTVRLNCAIYTRQNKFKFEISKILILSQNHEIFIPYGQPFFYQTFENSINKQMFDGFGFVFW